MLRSIPTPERPHFIFGGKLWEIENKHEETVNGLYTTVKFEHVCKTCLHDQDLSMEEMLKQPEGAALTIYETVVIKIDGEYSEPTVSIYKRNKGTMVGKKIGKSSPTIKEIEPFTLSINSIQKLVKEAEKIDMRNRQKTINLSPEYLEMVRDIETETAEMAELQKELDNIK